MLHHFIEFPMPEASISMFIVKLLNNFDYFFVQLSQPKCSCASCAAHNLNALGALIFPEGDKLPCCPVFTARDKILSFLVSGRLGYKTIMMAIVVVIFVSVIFIAP